MSSQSLTKKWFKLLKSLICRSFPKPLYFKEKTDPGQLKSDPQSFNAVLSPVNSFRDGGRDKHCLHAT